MNRKYAFGLATAFVFALAPLSLAQTKISSQPEKLVVLGPEKLPEAARAAGESFFLRSVAKGGFYLYVEQEKGSELTVFDVTDPSEIKVKSVEHLVVAGPYDFIRPLGDDGELLRFREGKGAAAVLDLTKENEPELRGATAIRPTAQTIVLDQSGSSANNEPYKYVPAVAHDYEVVDSSSPEKAEVVVTVKQVEHELTNKETGTTFLLGASGLTVIRRTDAEEAYKAKVHQMDAR